MQWSNLVTAYFPLVYFSIPLLIPHTLTVTPLKPTQYSAGSLINKLNQFLPHTYFIFVLYDSHVFKFLKIKPWHHVFILTRWSFLFQIVTILSLSFHLFSSFLFIYHIVHDLQDNAKQKAVIRNLVLFLILRVIHLKITCWK